MTVFWRLAIIAMTVFGGCSGSPDPPVSRPIRRGAVRSVFEGTLSGWQQRQDGSVRLALQRVRDRSGYADEPLPSEFDLPATVPLPKGLGGLEAPDWWSGERLAPGMRLRLYTLLPVRDIPEVLAAEVIDPEGRADPTGHSARLLYVHRFFDFTKPGHWLRFVIAADMLAYHVAPRDHVPGLTIWVRGRLDAILHYGLSAARARSLMSQYGGEEWYDSIDELHRLTTEHGDDIAVVEGRTSINDAWGHHGIGSRELFPVRVYLEPLGESPRPAFQKPDRPVG